MYTGYCVSIHHRLRTNIVTPPKNSKVKTERVDLFLVYFSPLHFTSSFQPVLSLSSINKMSISINQSRVVASQQALLNLRVWESCLSLRISLQKILEIANKLPVLESSLTDLESSGVESKLIQSALGNLYEMLQPSPNLKRKRSDILWEDISDQYEVNSVKWKDVLNKWNSRLNFGSKDTQSKMKTFRQTLWEQVLT